MLKEVEGLFEPRRSTIEEYRLMSPKFSRALQIAEEVHVGQKRKSGEPYIEHPKAVAQIMLDWFDGYTPDEDLMCACQLHDTVEDHPSLDKIQFLHDIAIEFGEATTGIVDGVSQLRSDGQSQSDEEYLQKQAAAGDKDIRVYLAKLADRLHNMRTLYAMPQEKQVKKAHETHTFAQLSERLGMWVVKRELEDLAFLHEQPETYSNIKQEVDNDPRQSPEFIAQTRSILEEVLGQANIKGLVIPRQNGYFSLHQKREKMIMQGRERPASFWHVNDLISYRVIIDPAASDEIPLIYSLLGQISNHPELNKYLDTQRFDDFISAHQPNLYSAMHQTFNFPQGATEVAITTTEREEFNNWGVMYLLRRGQLNEASKRYDLKIVFDQRGRPLFLPRRATGIDFAYALNPRLGATADVLIIDGKEVDITLPVPPASVIFIQKSKFPRRAPPSEYLDHCSKETRLLIDQQYNLMVKEYEIEKGRNILEPALAEIGLLDAEDWPIVANTLTGRFEVASLSDVYFLIGRSGPEILENIRRIFKEDNVSKENLGLTTIRVRGKNQPNVLRDITALVSHHNQGLAGDMKADIKHTRTAKPITDDMDTYELRIVLKDKAGIVLKNIQSAMLNDDRFDEVTIV